MIGIILLIGIVKKNAIMMIDFALAAERNEGMSPRDAIYQACLLRFRPIMMTTCCALLGGMPLALGYGTGSELRQPLGIAIVGGLIVSQMLTLFTTPVIYLSLDRLRLRFSRKHEPKAPPPRYPHPGRSRGRVPIELAHSRTKLLLLSHAVFCYRLHQSARSIRGRPSARRLRLQGAGGQRPMEDGDAQRHCAQRQMVGDLRRPAAQQA